MDKMNKPTGLSRPNQTSPTDETPKPNGTSNTNATSKPNQTPPMLHPVPLDSRYRNSPVDKKSRDTYTPIRHSSASEEKSGGRIPRMRTHHKASPIGFDRRDPAGSTSPYVKRKKGADTQAPVQRKVEEENNCNWPYNEFKVPNNPTNKLTVSVEKAESTPDGKANSSQKKQSNNNKPLKTMVLSKELLEMLNPNITHPPITPPVSKKQANNVDPIKYGNDLQPVKSHSHNGTYKVNTTLIDDTNGGFDTGARTVESAISHILENNAADRLVRCGFAIGRTPKEIDRPWENDALNTKKEPDYSISGRGLDPEIFDHYAPKPNTLVETMCSGIVDKLDERQAKNFVIDLTKSNLNPLDVIDYLETAKMQSPYSGNACDFFILTQEDKVYFLSGRREIK